MSDIDALLHKYATEAADIESKGTSAGYYTFLGLLVMFSRELLEQRSAETTETDADRIAKANPDTVIKAIKELRQLRVIQGKEASLLTCKNLIDDARKRAGMPRPGTIQ